jgi:non-heme chloroperoxidase
MHDDAVEKLFSLFTSSDRAVAMAGDLAEERERSGWIRFWLHVVSLTFVLWKNSTTGAPLRVLGLVLAGLTLLSAPAFAGFAAVALFPLWLGSAVSWIALSVFWWGGALWAGASLAFIAPQRGMSACAIVAVAGAALLMALGVMIEPRELTSPVGRMFFIVGLGSAVALLAGGAIARRRTIVIAVPFAVTIGFAATALFVTAAGSSASAQQKEWRDSSPHVVKSVEVDTDVRLEVLDWGGSGRALLLLAGGGDTAHVFDDLAPTLAKRYRVVGVTRRGHPGSSAPLSGYAVARLAEDIVRVMDTIGLKTPVVVGHSYAGEEMHALGARHSSRVAGLVYVDAAFDRGDDADSEAFNAVARTLPAAPSTKAADLTSFTALRAYLEKYGGAGPEAHVRARWVANPDGSVAGRYTPDKAVIQAMTKEMRAAFSKPYTPERISVPAVAIYAVPKSADALIQRGSSDRLPFLELAAEAANDPAVRERVEKLYLLTRQRVRNHEKWFEAFAERGRIVELSGTHHLIISNPREVLQQIESFVSSLPKSPH